MNKQMKILIGLILISDFAFGQNAKLETVYAVESASSDYSYVDKLDDLINGEFWGFHSGPIGIPKAESTLKSQGQNDYKIENIHDLDLTTAWIEGNPDYGIGESFTIEFDWKEDYQGFGRVYNFYGVIEVFNGYCKSEKHWIENSRIKTLKMYYNDKPICLIELVDTWQYQRLDLRKFFNEPNFFPNGEIYAKDGDKLKFEIHDVYKGTKYKDTGLSEFVFESPNN